MCKGTRGITKFKGKYAFWAVVLLFCRYKWCTNFKTLNSHRQSYFDTFPIVNLGATWKAYKSSNPWRDSNPLQHRPFGLMQQNETSKHQQALEMVKEFSWSPSGETKVQEIAAHVDLCSWNHGPDSNTFYYTTQHNKQRSILTHVQGWRNKGVYPAAQVFYFSVDEPCPRILM